MWQSGGMQRQFECESGHEVLNHIGGTANISNTTALVNAHWSVVCSL